LNRFIWSRFFLIIIQLTRTNVEQIFVKCQLNELLTLGFVKDTDGYLIYSEFKIKRQNRNPAFSIKLVMCENLNFKVIASLNYTHIAKQPN